MNPDGARVRILVAAALALAALVATAAALADSLSIGAARPTIDARGGVAAPAMSGKEEA